MEGCRLAPCARPGACRKLPRASLPPIVSRSRPPPTRIHSSRWARPCPASRFASSTAREIPFPEGEDRATSRCPARPSHQVIIAIRTLNAEVFTADGWFVTTGGSRHAQGWPPDHHRPGKRRHHHQRRQFLQPRTRVGGRRNRRCRGFLHRRLRHPPARGKHRPGRHFLLPDGRRRSPPAGTGQNHPQHGKPQGKRVARFYRTPVQGGYSEDRHWQDSTRPAQETIRSRRVCHRPCPRTIGGQAGRCRGQLVLSPGLA